MENGEWRIGWRTPILHSPFSILNQKPQNQGLQQPIAPFRGLPFVSNLSSQGVACAMYSWLSALCFSHKIMPYKIYKKIF
jgi:hypothetical protein